MPQFKTNYGVVEAFQFKFELPSKIMKQVPKWAEPLTELVAAPMMQDLAVVTSKGLRIVEHNDYVIRGDEYLMICPADTFKFIFEEV